MAIVAPLAERLAALPGVLSVTPAGALRRGEDFVPHLTIVASAAAPDEAAALFLSLSDLEPIEAETGELRACAGDAEVAVRFVRPSAHGITVLELTGGDAHLEQLRNIGSLPVTARSEEEVYASLGLAWIPPEIRSGNDEIDAAREGRLPVLVSAGDIRGDLHMHSRWSDGRNSIEEMVRTCVALGYEYMAITDHSFRANASRTLSPDDVAKQADEIAAVRQGYPDITVLHGCEVDIMPDGRLDFDDDLLERFDIVLASLHDRAGHDGPALLNRYISAMRHPLVTTITHPTNRVFPTRDGYDLDYERLFGEAAETGTVLEIDGSPSHLDLNGTLARRAIELGATVVIDSDCHLADMLGRQMDFGLLLARRGWVEPRHVLNTRPIDDVRKWIAAKRQR